MEQIFEFPMNTYIACRQVRQWRRLIGTQRKCFLAALYYRFQLFQRQRNEAMLRAKKVEKVLYLLTLKLEFF